MDYATLRRTMVDTQLRTFDVTDRAVLAAMEDVPRELHVPDGQRALAYLDRNITSGPSDDPRVVLAPMVLARLIQSLEIEIGSRVLVVADSGGYAAAVLERLGAAVTSVEQGGATADRQLYDAILVNGAIETRPDAMLARLVDDGRLGCISTERGPGHATLFVKSGDAIGFRTLFDATAPVLAEFRRPATFAF